MKYETQSCVRVYRTWLCQAAILANAGKTRGGGPPLSGGEHFLFIHGNFSKTLENLKRTSISYLHYDTAACDAGN